MNRFKCPDCGGEQYTASDIPNDCIYCGHKELEKVEMGPVIESEAEDDERN